MTLSNAVGLKVFFTPLVVSFIRSAVRKFHSALVKAVIPKVIGSTKYGSEKVRFTKYPSPSVDSVGSSGMAPTSVQPVSTRNDWDNVIHNGICRAGRNRNFHD